MESSDDQLIADLNTARAFMESVRQAQSRVDRKLSGRSFLSREQLEAVRSASASSSSIIAVKKELHEVPVNRLFERFEEMCRRPKTAIEPSIRPSILKLLALELWNNVRALHATPDKLVSVTMLHGDITSLPSEAEFRSLLDTPYVFTAAAVGRPADPRGFLRWLLKETASLAAVDEFRAFRDTPSIFQYAATYHPSNPGNFLRLALEETAAMAAEKEFESLRDTPGIFRHAVVHHSTNPRWFLRTVLQETAAMAKEPEFENFRDTPGIFTRACLRQFSDPRAFVRGCKRSSEGRRTHDDTSRGL